MELLVTLTCIMLSLVLFCKYIKQRSTRDQAPGPKGYPLVGSALQLVPEKIHDQFYEFAKTYGKIFQIQVFDSTTLVLNSVDVINQAFSGDEHKGIFNNRPHIYFAEQFYFGGLSITYKSPDKDHSNLRKVFTKGLHVYGDGIPHFEEIVKHELERVMAEINKSESLGFEMVELARQSLCNIISMLLIGKEVTTEDVQNFLDFISGEDFFINPLTNSLLVNFPSLHYIPAYKLELDKVTKARQRILDKYFLNVKQTWKQGTVRGLVDFYIGDQVNDLKDDREPVMTDDKIQANILDLISAGILTTAAVLPSTMLCLINNPGYQTKIQEELDRVVGTDREPTISDKNKCHFLEAVVMETLRYLPPVPLLLPHMCSVDTRFEGYQVNANTIIIANAWYVHHDADIWGDPWVFRPERFLDVDGKLLPSSHEYMKSSLSFGTGRCRCPGDGLARTRIFLYLASFLQKWSFLPVPGKCGSSDPRVGEFDLDITYKPKPFYCVAKSRF